jgi:ribonuclease E
MQAELDMSNGLPVEDASIEASMNAADAPVGESGEAGEAGEARRRSRRRRGGRGRDRGQGQADGDGDNAGNEEAGLVAVDSESAFTQATRVQATIDAAPAAPVFETTASTLSSAEPVLRAERVAIEPVTVVETTIVASAPVVMPVAAPVAAPVQAIAAASIADTSSLIAVVENAGLQWVQTAPSAMAEPEAVAPVARTPRVRKPRPVAPAEPLMQVETGPSTKQD